MLRLIFQRLLLIPPALLGINFLGFTYAHFARPLRAKRIPYMSFVEEPGPLFPAYGDYLRTLFNPELRSITQAGIIESVKQAATASLGLLALALALSLLIGFLLFLPFVGEVATRLGQDDDGSAASRLPLMALARNIAVDHLLLGVGPNNFVPVMHGYVTVEFSGAWLRAVHNKYMLVWSETGTLLVEG